MSHAATYSPEDDKIRLYFDSRIPKDEWDRLRVAGFSWCMKQSQAGGCDMTAVWSIAREDLALEMAGEIGDEDQPRAERSADRADRFEGYGDKREGEAVGLADRYDTGPAIHANQSAARAERAAERHDRVAAKAVNQWDKAEYWTRRTAGVIAHALYVERADVRHRRIKGLEADERKILADVVPSQVIDGAEMVRRYCGEDYVSKGHDCVGMFGQGRAKYAKSFIKADGPPNHYTRALAHVRLRIAYERQMLDAQGGTGADVTEMEAGGFIGKLQVQKVTKDRAGRVSALYFRGPHPYRDGETSLHRIAAEQVTPGSYRAPSADERAAFAAAQKATKKSMPKAPPLINPTPEDAAKLQAAWNAQHADRVEQAYGKARLPAPLTVVDMNQAAYSERSKGDYGVCKTVDVCADWTLPTRRDPKPVVFRVRTMQSQVMYGPDRVVVLVDKTQTTLPETITADTEVANVAAV